MRRYKKNTKMHAFFVITFAAALNGASCALLPNSFRTCWNDMDFKKTEKNLRLSPILEKHPLYAWLGIKKFRPDQQRHLLVILENGLKAVFKPQTSYLRIESQLTAYRFARFMGFDFVPPAVSRKIDGKKGILQLFIEGADGHIIDPEKHLTEKEKSDIYVFLYILGNSDTGKHQIIFGRRCRKPALIDNDLLFVLSKLFYGKDPYRAAPIHNRFDPPKSWKNFPVDKLQSVEFKFPLSLKEKLSRIHKAFPELSNNRKMFMAKNAMPRSVIWTYVKWRGAYWIQMKGQYGGYAYTRFIPSMFRKKTLQQLSRTAEAVFTPFFRFCPNLKSYFPKTTLSKTDSPAADGRLQHKSFAKHKTRSIEALVFDPIIKRHCRPLESWLNGFFERRSEILEQALYNILGS